jgi:hypothetical protein
MANMFGVDWSDPQTLWLNLTNLALGLVTVAAIVVVGVGVARELVVRRQRARELNSLDAELNTMLGGASAHVMHVPELGLTMADGGQPLLRPQAEDPAQNSSRE